MLSLAESLSLAAAVGAGLVAGLCFAFWSFIIPAFDALAAPNAIRAMQAINTRILRSSAMAVWFGTVLIGIAAAVFAENRAFAIAGASLYAVAALPITGLGNVPLNEALDDADPDAAGAADIWAAYSRAWGRWNALRTLLLVVASGAFVLAG